MVYLREAVTVQTSGIQSDVLMTEKVRVYVNTEEGSVIYYVYFSQVSPVCLALLLLLWW